MHGLILDTCSVKVSLLENEERLIIAKHAGHQSAKSCIQKYQRF